MLKFIEGQTAHIQLIQDVRSNKGKIPYFIKLRPHQTEFIKLNNPKAVLEYELRNFTCLHEGDTIPITFNKVKFDIDIL
jgi:ubiquitin fusion degradation protein 1